MKNNFSKGKIIGIIVGVLILIIIILLLLRGCTNTKEYTVDFDSNGGTAVDSVTVKENETIEEPEEPTREGYVFEGWYYKKKLFDFNTKIKKNMTLKAKWSSDGTGIELEKTTVEMIVDDELSLVIKSLLEGIDEDDLVWESSDNSIVTVDKNGKLKALKEGKATITVKTKDGKRKTTVEVTVKAKEQPKEEQKPTQGQTNNTTSRPSTSTPSQPATPSRPAGPTQPTYVIYMTRVETAVVGGSFYYTFVVKKDNVNFSDYSYFEINGTPIDPHDGRVTPEQRGSASTATLHLNNGSTVTASIR